MPTEFIQRQIDRILAEAVEAIDRSDWAAVRQRAENVLRLDPQNSDAQQLLDAAAREPDGVQRAGSNTTGGRMPAPIPTEPALIKTEGLDAEGRERISRVAQAMGRLGAHPHIVAVFDAGVEPTGVGQAPSPVPGAGEGTPYLVTELMRGGDIEPLLERAEGHRLPIGDAVDLAIQVYRGLEFAHAHGLVHRDLKPGNVWLTGPHPNPLPEGEGTLVAKIGDFGAVIGRDFDLAILQRVAAPPSVILREQGLLPALAGGRHAGPQPAGGRRDAPGLG